MTRSGNDRPTLVHDVTSHRPGDRPGDRGGPASAADGGHAGDRSIEVVLIAALVAMAVASGLIQAFSFAVMPNLAGADDRTFVATMQRYNQNPVFPVSFAVALGLLVAAVWLQRRHRSEAGVAWTVTSLVLYGVVLAVTFGLHVPLNEEIDRAGDPDHIDDLADVRSTFEGPWVAGNVVRTLFATAAVAALARALFLHGRRTGHRVPTTNR